MDDTIPAPSQPPDGARPRARGPRRLLLLWGWVAQWWRWDERPTPAAYRLACDERDALRKEVTRLTVALNNARADADASAHEVEKLAGVCLRDRERVAQEQAELAAGRERALSDAAAVRTARRPE